MATKAGQVHHFNAFNGVSHKATQNYLRYRHARGTIGILRRSFAIASCHSGMKEKYVRYIYTSKYICVWMLHTCTLVEAEEVGKKEDSLLVECKLSVLFDRPVKKNTNE